MRYLRGEHYAHTTLMQIMLYLSIIFSWSEFPTQYNRLCQQQLGFSSIFFHWHT